jgi:transposase
MKRFIEGEDRLQGSLLPECLDDYIAQDNAVRVVDAFVEELDLHALGFAGAEPAGTGRPSYRPAVLLKIYIYGYLNRVQSSRRLERECQRNIELMWLTGRLAPDFKTIADFRRDSGKGIRNACRQFVTICRSLKLLAAASVAVDGSKFKAVNNRDRNFTPHKLAQRERQVQESIERYLAALDTADLTQPADLELKTARLQDKLSSLRQQMKQLRQIGTQLRAQPDEQLSLTDPDARSMATSGRGTGMVGYNVQLAADTKHHLIVAQDIINVGSDRSQLSSMANQAREAVGQEKLEVLADRGYFKGSEILACEQAGIKTYVPKPMTSNSKAQGRFSKLDFIYIARDDEYLCPAGERLKWHQTTCEDGMNIRAYWTNVCPKCPLKAQCTTSKERRVRRWEHEAVLEKMQRRLDRKTDAMKVRRRTIEHVFGTLKHWMGSAHFLMKTLDHVRTEMSLHVLAYNLKRVISILGIAKTLKAMRLAGA